MTKFLVANLPNPPLMRASFLVAESEPSFVNVTDLSKAIAINRPMDILQYISPGDDGQYYYIFHLYFVLSPDHVFDNLNETGTETAYYTVPNSFVVLRELEAAVARERYALPVDCTLCRCTVVAAGYPSTNDAIRALEKHAHIFNSAAQELKDKTDAAYASMLERTR